MRSYRSVYRKFLFMVLGLFSLISASAQDSENNGQVIKIGMIADVHDQSERPWLL